MKKVLIISPYFAPFNTADMQRVRMSLAYLKDFGWEAEVVKVADKYLDAVKDPLLLESIPNNQIIHEVAALPKKWTSKLGLGSVALRSLWYYRLKVNQLLKSKKYDLIYFSTTQFPVCILGAYWKKKFKIPYVIDMQDPWHSEYYQNKPKDQRPKKYWFSYRLNKFLEPIAMKKVDGLIAVSEGYYKDLTKRFQLDIPCTTITFGAFEKDMEIAKINLHKYPPVITKNEKLEVGYIGRGGYDMQDAISVLFDAFNQNLSDNYDYFSQFHFNFMGTSYASKSLGKPTISPLAKKFGLINYVTETTDRLSFYQTINTLSAMDILFICGSNDEKYTASKIYPYLQLEKPLLAIFHEKSLVVDILQKCSKATVVTFQDPKELQQDKIKSFFQNYAQTDFSLNWVNFLPYTAKEMTKKQVSFFNQILITLINKENSLHVQKN